MYGSTIRSGESLRALGERGGGFDVGDVELKGMCLKIM